jgi:hypothetical protein
MYNVELNGIDRVWKLLNWMPQYILYMTELCKILLGENWTELIELGWKLDWKILNINGVKIRLKNVELDWINWTELMGWKLDWKLLNLTEFNAISVL